MAQLTAGQVESVELYSGEKSQVVEMQNSTHGSATTWYKGDLVVTASGLVNAQAAVGAITGIAMDDASITSYERIDIALIDPAAIYVMRMEYDDYSARALIGLKYPITYSTGYQRINSDSQSNPDVYIVGIHPSDKLANGSTGIVEGRVLVRFIYTTFIGV